MYIGNKEVRTGKKIALRPPDESHIRWDNSMKATSPMCNRPSKRALAVKASWASLSWENRAAIFLKAADLIATKYRLI